VIRRDPPWLLRPPLSGQVRGEGGPQAQSVGPKDAAAIATQVAGALVQLGSSEVIDVEAAQEIFAQLMLPLGIKIDVEAMRKRLEDEKAEEEATAEEETLDADIAQAEAAIAEDQVTEAFDESKVHREGGKFASKDGGGSAGAGGPSLAEKMKAAGTNSLVEYLDHLKEKKAEAKKGGEGKATGGGGKGGGKKDEKKGGGGKGGGGSAPKPMAVQALKKALGTAKPGQSASLTVGGKAVTGTVERSMGGMVMIRLSNGNSVVVHDKQRDISGAKFGGG